MTDSVAQVRHQGFGCGELGDLGSKLIVQFGKQPGLDGLHRNRKGNPALPVTVVGFEFEIVADRGTVEVVVEIGCHRSTSDLVEILGSSQAGHRFAAADPFDVDGHQVALGDRAFYCLKGGQLRAERVDLCLNLLVAHLGRHDLQAEVAVTADRQSRPHRDHGIEGHRTTIRPAGDPDLGTADGIDLMVDKGPPVVVG